MIGADTQAGGPIHDPSESVSTWRAEWVSPEPTMPIAPADHGRRLKSGTHVAYHRVMQDERSTPAKAKAPVGAKPFAWTPEIEEEIFRRMMGGEGIEQICAPGRDDWMPGVVTFYKRLSLDPDFAKAYARAREVQAHHEADEIRAIADSATPENVHVARLQVDARKWRASKLAPKVYGDKLALGGDAENPLQVVIGHADSAL